MNEDFYDYRIVKKWFNGTEIETEVVGLVVGAERTERLIWKELQSIDFINVDVLWFDVEKIKKNRGDELLEED